MPIKGLTDQGASFPQIGVLRKGAPKGDRAPGKDLQHFRLDTRYDDVRRKFAATYGPTPATINIYLPYATPEENFDAWQEEYVAGGLVHRCDGETMVLWRTDTGTFSQTPKPCPYATGELTRSRQQPGCKPVGRLKVIIPELERFAYVLVTTTSIHDIIELQANLNAAFAMRGDLRGIPFKLSRRPRLISTPGSNGKRIRREKWLLFLEPAPEWVALQIESMKRQALPGVTATTPSLPSGLDPETGEIIDAEPIDDEPGEDHTSQIIPPDIEPVDHIPSSFPATIVRKQALDPMVLRLWLTQQADAYRKRNRTASKAQIGDLHRVLANIITDDDARHHFQSWLTGYESMAEMDGATLLALHTWLKPAPGNGPVDPYCQDEIALALDYLRSEVESPVA